MTDPTCNIYYLLIPKRLKLINLRILFLTFISILLSIVVIAQTKDRCYEQAASFYDPQLSIDLEEYTTQWLRDKRAISRSKITIPVVVHIVWKEEEDNISEEQIHSQIAALNRDFQLENNNLSIVPNSFENSIGNVGFEFCLATVDPEGNSTTGITRTETRFTNVGARLADPIIYYTDEGGKDAWDTEKYLNIWVGEIPNILGYATRPGEHIAAEDGVVVHTDCFGTMGTVKPPYDLGRTTTHEIGHYFNLLHLNGDGISCEEGDMVLDTPPQMTNYRGCPDSNIFSCGSQDLIANYMNWVDDACMALFTQGQVDRMHAALNGARSGLLENTSCLTTNISTNAPLSMESILSIYPNPARDHIYVKNISHQVLEISYQIFDTKGKVIKEGIFQNNNELNRISLPFPRGMYFLKCTLEKEVLIKALLLF